MSDPNVPVTIRFDRLHCTRETSESGSDDPYCVFVVSNLKPAIPQTVVQITDTFSMGEGDTRRQGQGQTGNRRRLPLLWALDGRTAAPILDPSDLILLIAVVESDGGPDVALSVRNAVQASLAANIASYRIAGLPRDEVLRRSRQDFAGAMKLGASPGLPFGEDEYLGISEFSLSRNNRLELGRSRSFTDRDFLGGAMSQGARYEVHLTISPSP